MGRYRGQCYGRIYDGVIKQFLRDIYCERSYKSGVVVRSSNASQVYIQTTYLSLIISLLQSHSGVGFVSVASRHSQTG